MKIRSYYIGDAFNEPETFLTVTLEDGTHHAIKLTPKDKAYMIELLLKSLKRHLQ